MVGGQNIASEHIAVLQVENVLIKVEPTLIHVGPVVRILKATSSSNNLSLLHPYPITRLSKPLMDYTLRIFNWPFVMCRTALSRCREAGPLVARPLLVLNIPSGQGTL